MTGLIERAKSSAWRLVRTELPTLARRFDGFHRSEDRRLLEERIFPYLAAQEDLRRILFVGCDWYTQAYHRHFKHQEYWTIEIDPKKRRYGARHHVVDALRNLERHFQPGYFDAIVCNGVFMVTAIETREEAEPSFAACQRCLRRGGWFILGWNDTPDLRPYPPAESETLQKLQPFVFPPLAARQIVTDTSYRHVYTFFINP